MSNLVKMYCDEPRRPGGPVCANVHESQVLEWKNLGWLVAEVESDPDPDPDPEIADAAGVHEWPPSLEEMIVAADSIDGLREIADENELDLHYKAKNVEKAKEKLLGQLE